MQPNFNSITCSSRGTADVKQTAEVVLPSGEDVKKPVSVYAESFIISKERGETETSVSAKTVFNFVYLAEEGYKKSEITAETNAKLPLNNPIVSVRAEDARIVASGDGFALKATVCFHGEADKSETHNALSGGEDIFVKEFEEELDVGTGLSEGTLNVEDEFEVNYAVSEVLMRRESVTITEISGGISAVVFSGEIALALNLLPLSENGDIVRETRTIPFRYEMENVGALPNMRAYGNVDVKRVAVRVVADEGKSKSTISVEILLGFSGEAIDSERVNLISDAYSKSNHLKLKKEEIDLKRFAGQFVYEEKVSGSGGGELPSGGRLIAVLGERLSVFSTECVGGTLKVAGTIGADAVFKNSDNGTSTVFTEIPFSIETEVGGDAKTFDIAVTDCIARAKSGGIELECTIKVSYRLYETHTSLMVSEVAEGEAREANTSSITVFMPSAGDELWDVAKYLGESEEDIMKYNPELVFPLGKEDRIIIYRQKI